MKISAEKKRLVLFISLLLGGVFSLNITGWAADSCVSTACHPNLRQGQKTHPADAACIDCHQGDIKAHVDHREKFNSRVICLECHDGVSSHKYLHPPVAQHECHLCHNPHGNIKNRLMSKGYSTKLFLPYSNDEYTLCFSCHKRDLLLFPDTSFSTGFRDNQRNLHYLHVNKVSRGRNCKLCHAPHGSELPKMIVETVEFGKWPMKLNFVKTENGGSCLPGCHKREVYNRKLKAAVKDALKK